MRANTYLELSDGASHKFYEVTVEAERVVIHYGRIGTEGKVEDRSFESQEQAWEFARRKVEDKLRKGYQAAQAGARDKKDVNRPMLDKQGKFWKLIELSRKGSGGDVYLQLDNLRQRLLKLPEEEVRDFDQVLWELMDVSYRADLWGAAYIICGGCSDDGFDYFRAWLILLGERAFADALSESDNLASSAKRAWEAGAEFDGEELLGIAAQVYEIKTGRNLYETRPPRSAPTLQGDLEAWADVDTTQENARRIYPRLCKLFLDG